MISTAYLRVYVPAGVVEIPPFDGESAGRGVRTDGRFLWSEPVTDDAFHTRWNGADYVCPRHVRLRMVEGILAFTGSFPKIPLVPEAEREALQAEVVVHRAAGRRSHILSSAWHVPLRWFGVFAPAEREVYDRRNGLGIRYRTGLGEAVDRTAWAVRVLEAAEFPDAVVGQVRDLETWLAAFAAGSMVELDYGSVADHFSDGDLAFDESAADVRESLEALERGDGDASRDAYGRVARRWSARQALTFSN